MRVRMGGAVIGCLLGLWTIAVTAAEPVVVDPETGPEAALELRAAFDDFVRVSEECRGADGGALACMCDEGDALQRVQAAMAAALEQHPDWKNRPLRYPEAESTLLITIPALRQQVSAVTSRCD